MSISFHRLFAVPFVVGIVIACGGANGGPGGGSALCGVNGSNQCSGNQPLCDSTLGCVQCRGDSDCPASDPRCVDGRCDQCASNSDCGAAAPACWADHQCHASCTSNTFCQQQGGDLPICNTSSGACVQCLATTDCAGNKDNPVCDTSTDRCVGCLQNSDCAASEPRCFLGDHKCVQCLANSDCGANQICDPKELQCRNGCTSNSQCSGTTPLCNTATSECVACLANSDCPSTAPLCNTNQGQCAVCLADTDCKDPTKPYCDTHQDVAVCVQCIKDGQCPQGQQCNNGTCQ